MEWYITRATLDSIALHPLAHATGGMIFQACDGPFGVAVTEYLETQYADRWPCNTILSLRDYLIENHYTLSVWAYRTREEVPSGQGDLYRIYPKKEFVLFERPRVRKGALIAVPEPLDPILATTGSVAAGRHETGNHIACEDGNLCRIYTPGICRTYLPISGEQVFDDPSVEPRGEFVADEETRIAVARRLQTLVSGVVAVQLAHANVVVNPGWRVGSATVSGMPAMDPAIPMPKTQCADALLSIEPDARDIVYVAIGSQLVCLLQEEIERFWNREYTGFESIAMHPIGTAVIRSRHPTYEPCPISLLGVPSVQEAGWFRWQYLTTFINVLVLDVGAIGVVIGRLLPDQAIQAYLVTMFHEQAHRAEAQAGVAYCGRWDTNLVGRAVAVGSEVDAEELGMAAADGLLIEDYDRVAAAIRKDLVPRIEKAAAIPDVRWLKGVKDQFPAFTVRVEGINPQRHVVYCVIEGVPAQGRSMFGVISAVAGHPLIKPYDDKTVIALVDVGTWLEDDYNRYRDDYTGPTSRYLDPDPEPNPVMAPLRGRTRKV